ncbi:unnamed protein product [Darwinula stevensoni]|uniref:Eukaryotic translation initiation factor 3 subunit H n=1 Tax=Darwinula stevensoni TaxID=69355 RepID=A0A7R9A534_9CRUS|nr:unnamed protein product [Darwinula stevensoni]CAG0891218.1 unnamed protein product [Darwinula stevensoni]
MPMQSPLSKLHNLQHYEELLSMDHSACAADSAVMKVIKHCEEEGAGNMEVAQGVLLGLVVDSVLEITNCFPFPRHLDDNMDEEDYQLEMMRNLRKVNIDHLHVGWYQSTQMANFLSPQLLESQFSYQTSIEESVVLIYDPVKTARGFLSIRAYRLTPEAVKLYKEDDFSPEAVKNLRLPYSRLLQEIPIVIRNSTLVNLLLLELQKKKGPVKVCESQFMDLGTTSVLERHLRCLMDCVDDLSQEMNKFNIYQRQLVKHQQTKHTYMQKRTLENEARQMRGEPPLPEEDVNKMFKSLPPPPRRETLIASGQVENYCQQISTFASQALGKLFLAEALQCGKSQSSI